MNASPYRDAVLAPPIFAPPVGWTGWGNAIVLSLTLLPVVGTAGMLLQLKTCSGLAVPRWDEAAVLIGVAFLASITAARAHRSVRRRLGTVRTRRAFTSVAWSVLGLSPAMIALVVCSGVALHFSLEHLLDDLCIDMSGLIWHGC
ncbi:MAG: hypothetical protein ABI461_16385 [Polyangiaceae bacterium]